MRAAMLTVTPRMLPSASMPPPSSTGPVWMPTRRAKPSSRVALAELGSERRRPRRRSPGPARTARSASSSSAWSAPNAASRLSPAYCRTLAVMRAARSPSGVRARCPSPRGQSSGSSRSLSCVEPTTSMKSTVAVFSCCAAPSRPRRAASFSWSGATAMSTTASPRSVRCDFQGRDCRFDLRRGLVHVRVIQSSVAASPVVMLALRHPPRSRGCGSRIQRSPQRPRNHTLHLPVRHAFRASLQQRSSPC